MAKQKKYEFTGEKIYLSRYLALQQIRALIDIPLHNVKKGDVGGYIQKQRNLSHDDDAWVADEAKVFGDAQVYDDALVKGIAVIKDNALISGNSVIDETVTISGSSLITSSKISGLTNIEGNVVIFNSEIGKTSVGKSSPFEKLACTISGSASIKDSAIWHDGLILVTDHASLTKGVVVFGSDVVIKGYAQVVGNCVIKDKTVLEELCYVENKGKEDFTLFYEFINGNTKIVALD